MKILKKIAVGLLAFAVAVSAIPISAIPVRAEEAEGNSLRLWYDEPASQGVNILSAGANYKGRPFGRPMRIRVYSSKAAYRKVTT